MFNPSLNILLVEDNFLNRRLTKMTLLESGYRVLESKNIDEALDLLQNQVVHVAILDINLGLPEKDGINLGKILQETYKVPFVYLTAYETNEIIKRAIETQPISYLTKPFRKTDLIAAIKISILQTSKNVEYKYLIIKENHCQLKIPLLDISHIESDGNYLIIHCNGRVYRHRSTIKHIVSELPEDQFVQIHRAYIINKHKIEKINKKYVHIENHILPISKNYLESIEKIIY